MPDRRQRALENGDTGIRRARLLAQNAAVYFGAAHPREKAEQVAGVMRKHFAARQTFCDEGADTRQHGIQRLRGLAVEGIGEKQKVGKKNML